MSWPQIALALKENRRELCLTGKEFNEHLEKHGLDPQLYTISSLNYLTIHNTSLNNIGDDIAKLDALQTLSLHSNKITKVCNSLDKLDKLKVLDLSHNNISVLTINFNALMHLTSINLSNNQLESIPDVQKCIKLQVLDLSHNLLKEFPAICHDSLNVLSDLLLGNNQIADISADIDVLTSLKSLDIANNQITQVPYNLVNCAKLKELNLKGNPVKDRRLLKLIDQCRTKQVLDYLKQHAPKDTGNKDGKKKSKGKQSEIKCELSLTPLTIDDNKLKLHLKHASLADDALKVIIKDEIKAIRPNIVCCLIHGLKFTDESFRKFIQMQNKLHETLCEKRSAATIATHDAKTLDGSVLIYTAVKPSTLKIRPLNAVKSMSGTQLFNQLQAEAEHLRHEKKRNVYSGIHKYLYLLEGKPAYACLIKKTLAENSEAHQEVISFPPITNSDISKVILIIILILLIKF